MKGAHIWQKGIPDRLRFYFFFVFLFVLFFEIGSLCVDQAALELRSVCLGLESAGIKDGPTRPGYKLHFSNPISVQNFMFLKKQT